MINFDKERCDRCNARSYMVANKNDLFLWFCRHHGIEHNKGLEADHWMIQYDIQGMERLTNPMISV